jgi:hypothetical protein
MTTKPCPSCREVDRWRKSDEICGSCKKLIEDGKTFRQFVKESDATEVVNVPDPGRSHDYPYIYRGGERGREFASAFHKLVWLLAKPVQPDQQAKHLITAPLGRDGGHYYGQCAAIQKGARELLDAVYQSAMLMVLDAYKEGKDDGISLLNQLASGEMSVDKFNERAISKGADFEEAKQEALKLIRSKNPKERETGQKLYRVIEKMKQ